MIIDGDRNRQDWAPKEARGNLGKVKMADDQYDRLDCSWAMVVTGVRANWESLRRRANTCGVTGLTGPIAGVAYLPVRVASDRDLENTVAQGSESRTAEEPCRRVVVCERESWQVQRWPPVWAR